MRNANWTWKRQVAAFTLVELLVVIGIIALLVAILLPALNRARTQAMTLQCMANLRSIGQSIFQYTNNNRGKLPYGYWDGDPAGLVPESACVISARWKADIPLQSDWRTLLMQNVFGKGDGTWATESLFPFPAFQCPAADVSDPLESSVILKAHYGCNPRLMPNIGLTDNANPGQRLRPYQISHIQRSSQICLMWDAQQVFDEALFPFSYGDSSPVSEQVDDYGLFVSGPRSGEVCNYLLMGGTGTNSVVGGDAIYTSPAPAQGFYPGTGDNGTYTGPASVADLYPNNFSEEIQWRHGTNEHNLKANFLFVDGHVETLGLNFGLGNDSTIGLNCDVKDWNIYVNPNQ